MLWLIKLSKIISIVLVVQSPSWGADFSYDRVFDLYLNGQNESALKIVNNIISQNSNDVKAIYIRGLVNEALRLCNQSIDDFSKVINYANEYNVGAINQDIARVKLHIGNLDDANRFLSLTNTHKGHAYYLLEGRIAVVEKEYTKAVESFETGLKELTSSSTCNSVDSGCYSPDEIELIQLLSNAYLSLGKVEDVNRVLALGRNRNPGAPIQSFDINYIQGFNNLFESNVLTYSCKK